MFLRKIDKIIKSYQVFEMADVILYAGYDDDGSDFDNTVPKVPKICRKESFESNKKKCHLRCTNVTFFSRTI